MADKSQIREPTEVHGVRVERVHVRGVHASVRWRVSRVSVSLTSFIYSNVACASRGAKVRRVGRAACCRRTTRCPPTARPKSAPPRAQRCHTRTGQHAHAPPLMELDKQTPGHPIGQTCASSVLVSTTNHRPQTAACTGLTPGSRLELTPFHIQGHHRPTAKWQVGLAPRATLRLESTSIESSVDLSSSARPTWT